MNQVKGLEKMAKDGIPSYVISLIKMHGHKDISLLVNELKKTNGWSYKAASNYLEVVIPKYFFILDQNKESTKYIKLLTALGTNLERYDDDYTYTDLVRKVVNLRPEVLHLGKIKEEDIDNIEKELVGLVLDWIAVVRRNSSR